MPKVKITLFIFLMPIVCLYFSSCKHTTVNPRKNVSWTPPSVYRKNIKKYLTPVSKIKQIKPPNTSSVDDILFLINEEIVYIGKNSHVYSVYHTVAKALTENGAKRLAESNFYFSLDNEKIYIDSAYTVNADGKIIKVIKDAALIKSDQSDADASLYDDTGTLLIIFPDVKIGSTVNSTVIVERMEPLIPNEYYKTFYSSLYEPQILCRNFIKLPKSMAKRLKFHAVGSGLPRPKKKNYSNSMTSFEWVQKSLPALKWESQLPPLRQRGPIINLSTIANWGEYAKWYNSILKERSTLNLQLRNKVKKWTEKCKTKKDVINVLFKKVARDVRYTGLEFGAAGYRPRDCNDVWKNKHGDCKEKANLLRAMLAVKGIKSYMTLLQTVNIGFIDKKIPSPSRFNHVILAVDNGGKDYLYCDPTFSYFSPGDLGPGDVNKEVLIIKPDNSYKFTTTPKQRMGEELFSFDLAFEKNRALRGWLIADFKGYWGAVYANYYGEKGTQQLRDEMVKTVQSFFANAEIIDFKLTEKKDWKGSIRVKIYFIVPSSGNNDSKKAFLKVYDGGYIIPDLKNKKKRFSPFLQLPDMRIIKFKYSLPEGWRVTNKPDDCNIKSPVASISTSWKVEDKTCTGIFKINKYKGIVSSGEYPLIYHLYSAAQNWLTVPLEIQKESTKNSPKITKKKQGDVEMELMPTGEGQLAFVDKVYPHKGDSSARKAALIKVIKWFPNDIETVYTAKINIVRLLMKNKKYKEAEKRIRELLTSYRHKVSRSSINWGEFLQAALLEDLDQKKAEKYYLKLGADKENAPYWRGRAYLSLGLMLAEKDKKRAVLEMKKGMNIAEAPQEDLAGYIVDYLIQLKQKEEMQKFLADITKTRPLDFSQNLFTTLLSWIPWYFNNGQPENAKMLFAELQKLANSNKQLNEAISDKFKKAKLEIEREAVYMQIDSDFRAYMKTFKPKWLTELPPPDKFATSEACLKKADELRREGKDNEYLQLLLYAITTLHLNSTELSRTLWLIANNLEAKERYNAFFFATLKFLDRLPETNDYYYEGKFEYTDWLRHEKRYKESLKIHKDLLTKPLPNQSYRIAVLKRIAYDYEYLREYDKALEVYRKFEKFTDDSLTAYDLMQRAIYINLNLGDYKEALRIIGFFEDLTDKQINQLQSPFQIKSFINMAKHTQDAVIFWQIHKEWWNQWLQFTESLKVDHPKKDTIIIPVIDDLYELGLEIGGALREKNKKLLMKKLALIMEATKWHPELTLESTSIGCTIIARSEPAKIKSYRMLAIEILKNFQWCDKNITKQCCVRRIAYCFDVDKFDEAEKLADKYLETYKTSDPLRNAAIRLLGLIVLEKNRRIDEVVKLFEKEMQNNKSFFLNMYNVNILSNLYHRQNRTKKEIAFLKQGLEDKEVKANQNILAKIQLKYDNLIKENLISVNFSKGVKSWISEMNMPWLDFTVPLSLADYRVKNIAEAMDNENQQFNSIEMIKLNLLIAQSEDISYRTKQKAFDNAVYFYKNTLTSYKRIFAMYDTILSTPEFQNTVKEDFLWSAIIATIKPCNSFALKKYIISPLTEQFSDKQKESMKIMEEYYKVDYNSVPELKKFAHRILNKPLASFSITILEKIVERLFKIGGIKEGEAMIEEMKSMQLPPDYDETKFEYRLRMKKKVSFFRRTIPVDEKQKKLIFTYFPEEKIVKPEHFDDLVFDDINYDILPEQEALAITLYGLKQRLYSQLDDDAIDRVLTASISKPFYSELRKKIFISTLKLLAEDDIFLSEVLFSMTYFFDIDNPDDFKFIIKNSQQYRDNKKYPLTSAVITLFELKHDVRTGRKINLEATLDRLDSARSERIGLHIKLNYYFIHNDISKLKLTVDGMSSSDMLSASFIPQMIPVLKKLHMQDELEVVKEAGERKMQQLISLSWAQPDPFIARRVLRLADVLNEVEKCPPKWIKDMSTAFKNSDERLHFFAVKYYITKEWLKLLESSTALIRNRPNYYDNYWYKGIALYKTNRIAEAVIPLKTFCKYSNNNIFRVKAEKIIAEANAGKAQPAKPQKK